MFDLCLVESLDVEHEGTEGRLYIEFSCIFHPACPNVNILHNDSTIVKTKKFASLQSRGGDFCGKAVDIPKSFNRTHHFYLFDIGIPPET